MSMHTHTHALVLIYVHIQIYEYYDITLCLEPISIKCACFI